MNINLNTPTTSQLTVLQKIQCLKDWNDLRRNGMIGDCTLRSVAYAYINAVGANISITGVMTAIITDIALESAEKEYSMSLERVS